MSKTFCEEINRIPCFVLFLWDDKIPQNRPFSAILNTKKEQLRDWDKQACDVDPVSRPQSIRSIVTTFTKLNLKCAGQICCRWMCCLPIYLCTLYRSPIDNDWSKEMQKEVGRFLFVDVQSAWATSHAIIPRLKRDDIGVNVLPTVQLKRLPQVQLVISTSGKHRRERVVHAGAFFKQPKGRIFFCLLFNGEYPAYQASRTRRLCPL